MTLKRDIVKQVDAELRAELRAQRDAIARYLAEVKRRRAAAVLKAREHCRRSKARASERAREVRERHRQAAKAEVQAIRDAAKYACKTGVSRARKRGRAEEATLEQRRRLARSDEKLLTGKRAVRAKTTAKERRAESDDEVAGNLEPALALVWRQVARRFKPRARISRTEQFLQWAEEHPDEVLALQYPDQEAIEREAAAEMARLDRALKKGRLAASDWRALGTSPAELQAVGLDPDSPDDVAAFLGGYAQHWRDMASDVPF